MREILFRGKRVDNGEWIYGDLLQDRDLGQMMIEYFDYYTDENGRQRDYCQYDVIPETVGQYTGLVDINGTKIFEGDILKFHGDMVWDENCVVEFGQNDFDRQNNIGFFVRWITGAMKEWFRRDLGYLSNETIEVIGNIHDNKELLEDE